MRHLPALPAYMVTSVKALGLTRPDQQRPYHGDTHFDYAEALLLLSARQALACRCSYNLFTNHA